MTDPTQYTPRNRTKEAKRRSRSQWVFLILIGIVVWLAAWTLDKAREEEPNPEPTWTHSEKLTSWRTGADQPDRCCG